MEDQEIKYGKALVRIHFSDRTKEERNETLQKAAEAYMKKVLFSKKKSTSDK